MNFIPIFIPINGGSGIDRFWKLSLAITGGIATVTILSLSMGICINPDMNITSWNNMCVFNTRIFVISLLPLGLCVITTIFLKLIDK